MHRQKLLDDLERYAESSLVTTEELSALNDFITFVRHEPGCFSRTTTGHVTASAWIVDHNKQHALLTHHKKLNLWLQLGGHADDESNTRAVALKEAEEESGIQGFSFLSPQIFDIDVHQMPNRCAYHYDVRYLLQAPAKAVYTVSHESHDLAWVAHDKINTHSPYRSIMRMKEKFERYFL